MSRKKLIEALRLFGADLEAKSGATLAKINPGPTTGFRVGPYTAELRRWTV